MHQADHISHVIAGAAGRVNVDRGRVSWRTVERKSFTHYSGRGQAVAVKLMSADAPQVTWFIGPELAGPAIYDQVGIRTESSRNASTKSSRAQSSKATTSRPSDKRRPAC